MSGGVLAHHLVNLLGLAAVDSVNLLAFAVIAGLWLGSAGGSAAFTPRAARFTGGAFCGIVLLSVLSVWVIGNNQELVRALLAKLWVMGVLGTVGLVIAALGLRRPAEEPAVEEAAEDPLTRTVLARFGIAATGVVLGVVQSATSVPFAAGMVLISFADSPLWSQIVQILFFALVAITPSACLIVGLGRVRTTRVAAATERINTLMARGRVAGRWLTVAVGLALVGFAVVRAVQIG